jgi:biotin synthase
VRRLCIVQPPPGSIAYGQIITTRTLQDRIDTLGHAREAGLKICCGGIVGMGEQVGDRLGMPMLLGNLAVHPESVPINLWNEVRAFPSTTPPSAPIRSRWCE